MKTDIDTMMAGNSLWVFGYGSLLWNPAFSYHQQVIGHIKGFKRRFFQGNTIQRGSASNPGRVAILVPDVQDATWGVAYEIRGQQHVRHALEHLVVREISKGGYHFMMAPFYPRRRSHSNSTSSSSSDSSDDDEYNDSADDETYDDSTTGESSGDEADSTTTMSSSSSTPSHQPFSVLLFTATPDSHMYMGPADLTTMARQVVAAHGNSGPNTEYVLRTAEYVRRHIPEDQDSHLFELEKVVREVMVASPLSSTSADHHHHQHQHPHPQRPQHDHSHHLQTLPQDVSRNPA